MQKCTDKYFFMHFDTILFRRYDVDELTRAHFHFIMPLVIIHVAADRELSFAIFIYAWPLRHLQYGYF